MARSFASGLIWGLVIVMGGLGVASQLAPMPKAGSVVPAKGEVAPAQPEPELHKSEGTAPEAKALTGITSAQTAPAVAEPTATEPTATEPSGAAPAADTAADTTPAGTNPSETEPSVTGPTAGGARAVAAPAQTAPTGTTPAESVPAPAPASSAGTAPALSSPASTAPTGTTPAVTLPAPTAPVMATPAETAPAPIAPDPNSPAPTAPAVAAPAVPVPLEAAPVPPAPQAELAPAPVPGGAPDALGASPETAPQPAVPAAVQAAPALDALASALTAPAPDQQPATVEVPAPEPAGPKDSLLVPGQGAGLAEPSRLPQIAAVADPGLAPAPLPQITPPASGDVAPAPQQTLAPHLLVPDAPALPGSKAVLNTLPNVLKPGLLPTSAPGVVANNLPQIGVVSPQSFANAAALAENKPIAKFARRFEGIQGKPLFAILLKDVGGAGMSRAELAKLPFPVSFVVDPLATDAKVAAETYRTAGQEVLVLANGLPAGADAGDVAETFQTLQAIVPEAVGVIDEDTLGFQDNRALASLVLPVIADQGRGLVTYDRGLNAADQIARRDGLPVAVVFRRLDGAGESQPTIRRYLDRAVFKASQMGSVVVLGDTRADTVAAILQWTIEGKASTVDLAPISAVMARK